MFLDGECDTLRKYYESEEYTDEEYSNEERYLYLLLYAPGSSNQYSEPMRGNTWLQKTMHFLTRGEDGPQYAFRPYNFGTFSDDLELLLYQNTKSGLIKQNGNKGTLKLTSMGQEIAAKLWTETSEQERVDITTAKRFFGDLNNDELIAYSYSMFPETTPNSEIINQFYNTRMSAAISMFKRQKVSLRKAAKIVGLTVEEFVSELQSKGIPAFHSRQSDFRKTMERLESTT